MQTPRTSGLEHRMSLAHGSGAVLCRAFAIAAAVLTTLPLAIGSAVAQATLAADGFTAVDIAVTGARAATIKAYVRRPEETSTPVPVVIGLHGCGGLFRKNGRMPARETDWADRWVKAGYAVVFPDSFNPRGYRQICQAGATDRPIRPRHRAEDALAVAAWLKTQPFADAGRIALVGWSNGGSSVLQTVGKPRAAHDPGFVTAIAFYPGCRPILRRAHWKPQVPLSILIGAADNWTPAAPCRELAAAHSAIRFTEYPDALHDFDAPNLKRRTLTHAGLSANGDGRVEIGTDPAARAAAIATVSEVLAQAFAAAPK